MPASGTNESVSGEGPYLENGRWYDSFRPGRYLFPVDEDEKGRLDMFHTLSLVTRNRVLHSAPIQNREGARVLDLGCGTGIWAIDVADMYYSRGGTVTAADLCRIQPEFIPQNLTCVQADIEEPWPAKLTAQPYDLIRTGMLYGSIYNWPSLYRTIYRNLKPRDGYIEHVEIDWTPRCDDGTLAPNAAVREWCRELFNVMAQDGRPMQVDSGQVARRMMDAGFTDFREESFMLPLSNWARGNETWLRGNSKDAGRWFNVGFPLALQSLSLAPMCRVGGANYDQVQDLLTRVKAEVNSEDIHAYCLMYVWTARRAS